MRNEEVTAAMDAYFRELGDELDRLAVAAHRHHIEVSEDVWSLRRWTVVAVGLSVTTAILLVALLVVG